MNQIVGGVMWLMSLGFMVALIFLAALIRYKIGDAITKATPAPASFGEYFRKFLWHYKIRLAGTILVFFFAGMWALLVLLTIVIPGFDGKKVKYKSVKELRNEEESENAARLAALGPTNEVRAEKIDHIFGEKTDTIHANYMAEWESWSGQEKKEAYVHFEVSRSLAAMDNREREHLRIVELLNSAADGKEKIYRFWRAALVWGDGKGVRGPYQYRGLGEADEGRGVIETAMSKKGGSVDQVISAINQHLAEKRASGTLPAALKAVVDHATEQLTQGRNGWLRPDRLKGTIFEPQGDHVVHIGRFKDGSALTYSGEGSMVTIAPPGSGKTQCNVFPTLLTWKGPAVVLDISGDIYENTSKWRSENVGPVYKFSPLEPESSHCYNPLTFVRSQPDYIWEDSKLLAEMMIVPSNSSEPFWENEARTILTAAIAHVCYANPPDQRPMHSVLDVIYGGEAWDNMILGLKMAADVRVMVQHANALSGMNEKTLSSVLQTARSSLGAWAGERISRVTTKSDWSPLDLRSGKNPTIYIYIRPNEVEAYLSLLRVFIGQHIRLLTGGPVPPRGSAPILFMLDELPRLRNMPPVDEALNIGRKYGLRLWMFAQSVGQLQEAYKNADGMLGSCAVRIFMNPSGADGLAEKLSEEIGYIDSFADAQRKRLVEASELAGPAYRDKLIVFGLGARPAQVTKDFAWKSETLKERMGSI